MNVLELEDVSAGYDEVDVVSDINLRVGPCEIVTVAGTNGAGKSTLIKAIMGFAPRCRGAIRFEARDLMQLAVEDRLALGIGYVPQVANVFTTLTVLENLKVVAGVSDRAAGIAEMFDRFPALARRRTTRAGALSGGERQQLAFARALMPKPRLMLLDEPTAALAPNIVDQVFELITSLPALGLAALVVEQRARRSLEISHRGYILDSGQVVMHGESQSLLSDDRMVRLYLGRT